MFFYLFILKKGMLFQVGFEDDVSLHTYLPSEQLYRVLFDV